jgi:hypothetical protein
MAETYTFYGSDCSTDTITVIQTVQVGGIAYYAAPETLTSQEEPLAITYHYSALTMAELNSVGPTASWVGSNLFSFLKV